MNKRMLTDPNVLFKEEKVDNRYCPLGIQAPLYNIPQSEQILACNMNILIQFKLTCIL